jgi:nitroreductase
MTDIINNRPWEFIAVTKREVLDEIARIHPYAGMCKTATAATQNILLEAAAIGLGTCWCGVYPKEDRIAEMARMFDIQEPKLPFCVIAVGVPDEAPEQRGFFDAAKVRYVE